MDAAHEGIRDRARCDAHPRRRPAFSRAFLFVIWSFPTLLVLLIVAATVGMHSSRTHCRKVPMDFRAIAAGIADYARENDGRYPASIAALLVPDAHGRRHLYATHVPRDPWGREYRYDPPSPDQPRARLYTLGEDGLLGGCGDDADEDNLGLEDEDSDPR